MLEPQQAVDLVRQSADTVSETISALKGGRLGSPEDLYKLLKQTQTAVQAYLGLRALLDSTDVDTKALTVEALRAERRKRRNYPNDKTIGPLYENEIVPAFRRWWIFFTQKVQEGKLNTTVTVVSGPTAESPATPLVLAHHELKGTALAAPFAGPELDGIAAVMTKATGKVEWA